jgi:hypothetical protein
LGVQRQLQEFEYGFDSLKTASGVRGFGSSSTTLRLRVVKRDVVIKRDVVVERDVVIERDVIIERDVGTKRQTDVGCWRS